ncbi:MAG TPA: glycoside hydrolase family 2 protein [Vicinamibacteria bacterium]|nr:glycoside hydrolase family 2 protein [Vicinamibacteria bacterium]
MERPARRVLAGLGAGALLVASHAAAQTAAPPRIVLARGWALQSSATAGAAGDAMSKPGFATPGWYAVTVPNTIVGALVENGTYPDPFPGMAFRSLPGATYTLAKNFSHLPLPDDSPYRRSWWYRTEFAVPKERAGRRLWLHFDGINYRANVWLNGEQVAAAKDVAGAFRRYVFDVTKQAKAGAVNALAVEVTAPQVTELAFNWVDWNPMPPDKNMGLWGEVYLTDSGPLALRHPQVVSRLDLPSLASADLTVSAEVWNPTDALVKGTLKGAIEQVRFERAVEVGPGQRLLVRFTPADTPALRMANPRVWWPYRLGAQELYTLTLDLEAAGTSSDGQQVRFGIQQMDSELTAEGHRLFKVNGRRLLIRGGGWASDMMLRRDPARLEAEMRYVRDMGLNTIRLEGKAESEEFYDLADRLGILVMTGWCCCDHWEEWKNWDGEDHWVAAESLRDQVLRLRNRPSVVAWFNGSDFPPPPDVERTYLQVLRGADWPKPIVSNAREAWSASGPSGVKMRGPYDYVPPSYWLTDPGKYGGAFGFSTEATGGMAVPPLESMLRMVGREHLWPMDAVWKFHAGGQEFADVDLFDAALAARYGPPRDALDYTRKAQALAYEGHRAMFEAFARNKYAATGVIQWMLNNAWPSIIWHLYDHYLRPAGAYYGTKTACRPLHVQYSYDDRSVAVVDDRHREARGLKVKATALDLELRTLFTREAVVDVPADGVVRAFALPEAKGLPATYFLKLDLHDGQGQALGSNFYWLSSRPDVLQWDKSTWYHTPVTQHADLTALSRLRPTTLRVSAALDPAAAAPAGTVTVENTGRALAFMVRLKLTGNGEELLPVLWEDNYFSLLPGEKRQVSVSSPARAAALAVEAEAWNAPAAAAPPPP